MGIEVGKAPNAPERESEMQDTPPCQYPQAAHLPLHLGGFLILYIRDIKAYCICNTLKQIGSKSQAHGSSFLETDTKTDTTTKKPTQATNDKRQQRATSKTGNRLGRNG